MRIVTTRAAARCAVCHDDLGEVAVACAGCDARGHVDCWTDLGRCPSLGCAPREAVGSPKPRRRWRLLGLLGVGTAGGALSTTAAREKPGPRGGSFRRVELVARSSLLGLLVVTSLGLLAAVVTVNVRGRRLHGGDRTLQDMKAIRDALELFRVDCGYYPDTLDALWIRPANAQKWGPEPYLKEYPPKDPWGNEYQYRRGNFDFELGNEYLHRRGNWDFEIVSYGADGVPGGDDEGTDLSSRTINALPKRFP